MSRPLRLQYPGAVYHLTSRGNARGPIFWDTRDRDTFLSILSDVIARYWWLCHAYCLMDNHYHLVVETPQPNLPIGMRQLNGLYSQTFNRRYARVGHLFQGRYKAIIVQRETHLLELCRYVVLNPVRAGIRRRASQWRWSSYRATAGLAAVPAFLSVDWVLQHFGPTKRQAQAQYRAFVEAGLASRPWQQLRGQIYLGNDEFVTSQAAITVSSREVPRGQRQAVKPSLREILDGNGDPAIVLAHREYGYQLREIADFLGVHPVTVRRRLRRVESRGVFDCQT